MTYTEGYGDVQSESKEHNRHISGEYFQEDDYICRGDGEEVWQARFSYKGFRYVEITGFTGEFTAGQVTALDLHRDLESRGSFRCANALVNTIHHASRRALLNNAHHTVTDTPTYEKNGWTGDAQLTTTMGLYNFGIERFYGKFVTDLRDSQLPSGEVAPIVPTSGWGLTGNPNAKWHAVLGAVPAWDAALFVMTWETYLFTGDLKVVRENYGAMQQYLTYLGSVANERIVEVGLGDWLPPGGPPSEGPAISSTAWYYRLNEILENCAGLMGDEPCRDRCRALKAEIREAFNKRFLNPAKDGYETGTETEYRQTSNILPLAFGLVPDEHHMFGSIDAWLYQYLAGIRPAAPGFREITVAPHIPAGLQNASTAVETPVGTVRSAWGKDGQGGYLFELQIPEGVKATFVLPHGLPGVALADGSTRTGHSLPAGRSSIRISPSGEVTAPAE